MMKNNILGAIAFAALLATSCSKQTMPNDPDIDLMAINFAPQLAQPTKSGHLDDNGVAGGFVIGDVIGVFGYEKKNGETWANNELPSIMHNVMLTKQLFEVEGQADVINYVYYPQKLWPSLPNKARFFAYYPHNSSVTKGAITPSDVTYSGYPFVDVALGLSQTPLDFVTAQTGLVDQTEENLVSLQFEHQLSKLIFKVKASGLSHGLTSKETRKMYINQLSINNVYNKAKYTFDDTPVSESHDKWSNHSPEEGATMLVSSVMSAVSENRYQNLIDQSGNGKEAYILMLPQKYDNVEFDVLYTLERLNTDGGCEDHTVVLKHFPVSVDWKSGKVYTYYLEFGFSEVDEDGITLSLSVENWKDQNYNVEIGQ